MGNARLGRVDGWPARLSDLIAGARAKPFAWGSHDCCTFALASFVAITGEPAPNVPAWSSVGEAQRLLRERPVAEWARLWFGPSLDDWRAAGRGDIALIDSSRGAIRQTSRFALAVVAGVDVCCPGETGLDFVGLSKARAVWRIG